MAYTSWTVVYGEQPSAAKWNILGTNDAYFNTQIGSNFSSGTTSTVWWEELGRTTLTIAGDTISVTGLSARKYLWVVFSGIATGGTLDSTVRFNNDSGSNYAYKNSANGGAQSDNTSVTSVAFESGATDSGQHSYGIYEISNIATQEKAFFTRTVSQDAAGAATVPVNIVQFGKWANTADQITRIDWLNSSGTGDFAIGSEVVVLGHD